MSTVYDDDRFVREMLKAYDAPQPDAAFRARLQQELGEELRQLTKPVEKSSQRWHRLAYVTAAGLLAMVGVAVGMVNSPSDVEQRPVANQQVRTGQVASFRRQPTTPPSVIAERTSLEEKPSQPTVIAAALPANVGEVVAEGSLAEPNDAEEDIAYAPMQFVMHTGDMSPTPEQQRWRQAWCFFMETTEPSEIFNRWQAYQSAESELDVDMAYRMQSAASARKQFDPLVRSLLADADDAGIFVDALINVDEETVQQLTAQLSSEMATSGTLYIELLHRSRDEHDMHLIDGQLQDALASDNLDEPHRELVRKWLQRLDIEKQRRNPGPIMM